MRLWLSRWPLRLRFPQYVSTWMLCSRYAGQGRRKRSADFFRCARDGRYDHSAWFAISRLSRRTSRGAASDRRVVVLQLLSRVINYSLSFRRLFWVSGSGSRLYFTVATGDSRLPGGPTIWTSRSTMPMRTSMSLAIHHVHGRNKIRCNLPLKLT